MPFKSSQTPEQPSLVLSVIIFVLSVIAMGFVKLFWLGNQVVPLTYGLPLLFCLVHRDRRLLWALVVAFVGMASYKAFVILPEHLADHSPVPQLLMQIINLTAIGGTVHAIMNLTERLRIKNAELEHANADLSDRAEEIGRQNEELQAQGEELAQQNEEIQAQSEELAQQNEELQAQTEELQTLNNELSQREAMLQMLLESIRETHEPALEGICELMLELFGSSAVGAAVVEKRGNELVVQAHTGLPKSPTGRWPYSQSFAAVVIEHDQTAYIEDLTLRPDLKVPNGNRFRSILASPLRLDGKPAGVVEIYSVNPHKWTAQDFKVIEWIAAQCSLIWEARRLRDEMAKTNATLEQLIHERTGKLQELVNELEHFSYTITHDMRAPLRAMQGYAGILEEQCEGFPNEESKDYLRRIMTAAGRMDRLITDALNYSKAVQQEMTLAPVNVEKLLRGIIESYPDFQEPQAQINLVGHFPHVLANEAGLTQCFSNLLNNAVKFVNRGQQPKIKIRAEQRSGGVRLWIEDNGIGIDEDMQPRIFGMFQRASKEFEGTGIGLALVRKVTERMAGQIGVESELGKGSRFWIELKTCN